MVQADGFTVLGSVAFGYILVGILSLSAGIASIVQKKDAGIVGAGLMSIIGVAVHAAWPMDALKRLAGTGAYVPYAAAAFVIFGAVGVFMAGKRPADLDQPSVQPAAAAPASPRERLHQLEALKNDGMITQEEWERRRMEILQVL